LPVIRVNVNLKAVEKFLVLAIARECLWCYGINHLASGGMLDRSLKELSELANDD
jgi:hypothetical protein